MAPVRDERLRGEGELVLVGAELVDMLDCVVVEDKLIAESDAVLVCVVVGDELIAELSGLSDENGSAWVSEPAISTH